MSKSDPSPDVVDACAFHEWASDAQLRSHMEPTWKAMFDDIAESYQGHGAGPGIRAGALYSNPLGNKDARANPKVGPAGSDPALLRAQLFEDGRRRRVVLSYDDGILATAYPDPYLARTAARAANQFTAADWLDPHAGIYGLILVAAALPEDAAADIRRLGRDDRWVGVALGSNSLAMGFGHPVYRPIFRAAAEMGLPVVIQTNSETAATLLTPPTAAGLAATFAEYKAHSSHAAQSHISGMILGGVFSEFPDLRVLVVGTGATWIPSYLWRYDYYFKIEAHEAPWLDALPSEYFRRHIRVATYPLERASDPRRVRDALATVPWLGSILMYASGYPNYDWQRPDDVLESIPADWHRQVLVENALDFYRWSGAAPGPVGPTREEVETR